MKNYIAEGDTLIITAGSAITSGAGVLTRPRSRRRRRRYRQRRRRPDQPHRHLRPAEDRRPGLDPGRADLLTGTACTNVASTNKLIGIAARAQLSADTTGRVRLNGAGVTP